MDEVTCLHMGTTCEQQQDLAAFQESVIANLTQQISPKEANTSYATEFATARQQELRMMPKHGVIGDTITIGDVKYKFPTAKIVRTHFIYSIKNAEGSRSKYKARLVAAGNRLMDCNFQQAPSDTVTVPLPVSAPTCRLIAALAGSRGLTVETADLDSAYLHAQLGGDPTYAILPREIQNNPTTVCKLNKALYGL
eukprot:Lankesteria_metandrocarpae@DN350_c0_g1_i1.p1